MLYELFTSDLEVFASKVVERRTVNDDDIFIIRLITAGRLDRHHFPDQLVGIFRSGEVVAPQRQRASREF